MAREYTQQFVFRLLSSASVFIAPLALRRLVSEVYRTDFCVLCVYGGGETPRCLCDRRTKTPHSPTRPPKPTNQKTAGPPKNPTSQTNIQPKTQVGHYLSQKDQGADPALPTVMWLCVLGLFLGACRA